MIVDSNSAASLQYVDPTYQVSLFVRANVYDVSGGSPSLEGFVNLTQIDNGVYSGKYTFTAGKPYLVQKLVYTDGTYTVVDQTFAQGTDDVQCINLRTANLDAAVSTRNSTSHFDAVMGTPAGASISADLAEIEAETDGIALIPTNPLLTNDARLNDLDATISSRASAASLAALALIVGTPAGASIAADLAEIEAETDGIAAIPTNPLLTNDVRLNDLDATISSRASAAALASLVSTIGVPAGASVSADLAEIESETDLIAGVKSQTDQFTFTGSDVNAVISGGGGGGTCSDFSSIQVTLVSSEIAAVLESSELSVEISC